MLLALVRQSDVLMHNMRPQAMARLGFAWERLREVNPRLVYCSAHGYGQDGPLADRPAFDDIIQGGERARRAWSRRPAARRALCRP